MDQLSRRTILQATTFLGAGILPAAKGNATERSEGQIASRENSGTSETADSASASTYFFFNKEEAVFIEAAVSRLIPADEEGPGAIDSGVPWYIDKQLAGAWGAGERLYRSGPWQKGTPSQGYQLPFTPAELFRTALAAILREHTHDGGFATLGPDAQDAYLQGLEAGSKDLGGVPSNVFFAALWEATVEGYFSDPVYGGNRNMLAWKMIGFPGAYASFYDLVDQHGVTIKRTPASLSQNVHGHVHVDSHIPANLP